MLNPLRNSAKWSGNRIAFRRPRAYGAGEIGQKSWGLRRSRSRRRVPQPFENEPARGDYGRTNSGVSTSLSGLRVHVMSDVVRSLPKRVVGHVLSPATCRKTTLIISVRGSWFGAVSCQHTNGFHRFWDQDLLFASTVIKSHRTFAHLLIAVLIMVVVALISRWLFLKFSPYATGGFERVRDATPENGPCMRLLGQQPTRQRESREVGVRTPCLES